MDTVTEAEMAIALAEEGGIGIIHRNMFLKAGSSEVFEKRVEGLLLERKPSIDLIL